MNKRSFKQDEVTPKKRFKMHKRKKQWIVLAIAFLSFLGGSGVVSVTCGGEVAYAEKISGIEVPDLPEEAKSNLNVSDLFQPAQYTYPNGGGNSASTDSSIGTNVVQLTPYLPSKSGVLWSKEQVCLDDSFEYVSYLFMGGLSTSKNFADGITFAFQNDARGVDAYGALGGGLGIYRGVYASAPVKNAAVIEFDTLANGPTGDEPGGNPINNDGVGRNHIALNYTNRTSSTDQFGASQHYNISSFPKDFLVTNTWEKVVFNWDVTGQDANGKANAWRLSWKYKVTGQDEHGNATYLVDEHQDINETEINEIFGFTQEETDAGRPVRFGFTAVAGPPQLNMVALSALPMNIANLSYKNIDKTAISSKISQINEIDSRRLVTQKQKGEDWVISVADYKLVDRELKYGVINEGTVWEKKVEPNADGNIIISTKDNPARSENTITLYYDNGKVTEAKPEAQKVVDTAVDDAKKEIEKLTTVDKEAILSEINKEKVNADKKVDDAETVADVNQAGKDGAAAIDLLVKKAQAVEALNKKADEMKTAIKALIGVDKAAKDAAIEKVQAALDSAIVKVNAAKTEADVTTALDEGTVKMTGVKDAIEKLSKIFVTGVENKINGLSNLSGNEKTAALSEVGEAGSYLELNQILARQEVINAANAATKKVADLEVLDKDLAKAAIEDEKQQALEAISNATDKAGAETARDKGINAIQELAAKQALEDKKLVGKAALEKYATEEIEAKITQLYGDDTVAIQKAKEQLRAQEGPLEKAVSAVDAAKDAAGVTAAVTSGKKAMDDFFAGLETTKAQDQLTEEKAAATEEIGKLPNLSTEEKGEHQAEVEEAENKLAIDKALAKAEIQNAANQTIAAINALDQLSAKEKADQIAKVNAAKNQAVLNIINGKTEEAVAEKTLAGIRDLRSLELDAVAAATEKAIDQLNNVDTAGKLAAKQEIADLLSAGKAATGKAEKAQVNTVVKEYAENLKAVLTPLETANTENLGTAKSDAVLELKEKANEIETAINNLKGLDEEQKQAALNQIGKEGTSGALQTAIDNVNNTNDLAEVKEASNQGKQTLQDIYNELQKRSDDNLSKAKAKNNLEVMEAAEKTKEKISDLEHLTNEEKKAARAEVENAKNQALEAIEKATSPDEVDQQKKLGVEAIEKVVDQAALQDAKKAAEEVLKNKAETTKNALDELVGVSKEDLAAGKLEIDAALSEALEKVGTSQTLAEVAAQTTAGKDKMDDIYNQLAATNSQNLQSAKDLNRQEVQEAYEKAKDTLTDLPNLPQPQKEQALAEIETEKNQALETIEKAKTPEGITKGKNDGIAELKDTVRAAELAAEKLAAEAELQKKAADIVTQINDLAGIADDLKLAAEELIALQLQNSVAEVKVAADTTGVKAAVTSGKGKMDEIYNKLMSKSDNTIASEKEKAQREIEKAAEKAREAIESLAPLSDTEKDAAKEQVASKEQQALEAIEKAETLDGITQEKNKGETGIQTVVETADLANEKCKAQAALDQKAADINDAIDKLVSFTDEERQTKKDEVNAACNGAKERVANAATKPDVATEEKAGKDQMDAIYNGLVGQNTANLDNARDKNKKEVADAATEAASQIDALTNLTEKEKEQAQKQVTKAKEEALAKIEQAENITGINDEKIKGVEKIQELVEKQAFADAKAAAAKELKQKALDTIAAMDILTGVDEKDAKLAKAEVQRLLAEGLLEIDSAENTDGLKTILTTKKGEMDAQYNGLLNQFNKNLASAKDKAQGELTAEAEREKLAIEGLPQLSKEEKAQAKEQVDQALDKALNGEDGKGGIQNSLTPADVQNAQTEGSQAIQKAGEDAALKDAKKAAQKELQQKIEDTKKAIDQLTNVSVDAKKDAKERIDAAGTEAQTAVEQATTQEQVADEKTLGKQTIDTIYKGLANQSTENLDPAKDKNKQDVADASGKAQDQINQLPNLTEEEKQAAIDEIKKEQNQGQQNIADSQTVDEAQKAKDEAVNKIETIVEKNKLQAAKNQALAELLEKRDSVLEAIGKLVNIDEIQLQAAKEEVAKAYDQAVTNVKTADTMTAVETAVKDGKAAMDKPYYALLKENGPDADNLKNAQEKNKADIAKEIAKAKELVEKLPALEKEERDEALGKLVQAQKDANQAIDEAGNLTDIQQAVTDCVDRIEETVEKSTLTNRKNQAIAALRTKAADTIAAIGNLNGVTKDAKEAAVTQIEKELAQGTANVQNALTLADVNQAENASKQKMDTIYDDLAKSGKPSVKPAPTPAPDPSPSTPSTPSTPNAPSTPNVPSLPGTSTNAAAVQLYRAYNTNNGEHLYTANVEEYQHVISVGWQDEGLAWKAVSSGHAVYRLYNPNSGEHFYTLDVEEYEKVAAAGWLKEGLAFYSNVEKTLPVYRLFNPNARDAGSHHFTTDAAERASLIALGWQDEGIAFYGME